MNYFKQSTIVTFLFGPFVNDVDGKTPETGLTISATDVRLSKNGADFVAKNESSTGTHDENGWYSITLDTTDLGDTGSLVVAIDEAGALPVWSNFTVLSQNVFEAIISGTDYLNTTTVSASSAATSLITTDIFSKIIDTKTFEEILEILLSMASGRIGRTDDTFTFYKQDNVTSLFTLQSERSERSRS